MPRTWTPEQKAEAAARMKRVAAAKKSIAVEERKRDPEVQAVIDSMPEDRKAKLASIQARQLAQLSQTQEGREALARMEARKASPHEEKIPAKIEKEVTLIVEPPKPVSYEIPMKGPFRLTGTQAGMMVSELGNCQCGASKLEWHPTCLKVKING